MNTTPVVGHVIVNCIPFPFFYSSDGVWLIDLNIQWTVHDWADKDVLGVRLVRLMYMYEFAISGDSKPGHHPLRRFSVKEFVTELRATNRRHDMNVPIMVRRDWITHMKAVIHYSRFMKWIGKLKAK